MTQVCLHLLPSHCPQAWLQGVVESLVKHYQQGSRVLVYAQDKRQAEEIDQALWAHEPSSFVPHQLANEPIRPPAPVVIGYETHHPQHGEILVNLNPEPAPFSGGFQRLYEYFINDDQHLNLARCHYKHYRQQGFEVEHIDKRQGARA